MYVECLEKRKSTLGENHPDMLNSMNNLAVLIVEHGHNEKAHLLYEECLEKNKSILLGEKHPVMLTLMNNLASFFHKQGDYEKTQCGKSVWKIESLY